MALDDMLWIDNTDDMEAVDKALAAVPRNQEGLKDLCDFLLYSIPGCQEAWELLFHEFEDLMTPETRKTMYAALKATFSRWLLRDSFYYACPEIGEEDARLVAQFPQTQEGYDALCEFLEKESNCQEGWERLFSAAYSPYRVEAVTEKLIQVLLNTGDYRIIASVLGHEEAERYLNSN